MGAIHLTQQLGADSIVLESFHRYGVIATGKLMSNNISPENEQFIQYELASGTFRSRDQLLDEAVRLLKRHRELQRDIQAGIDSGPPIGANEVFHRLEEKAQHLSRRESP